MIKTILHFALGWMIGALRKRGYLTDPEAVKAQEAVETLAAIGMDEAAKPHGESKEQIKAEAVADYVRKTDPDHSADSLNALQRLKGPETR